jgi:hypothetical protein
MNTLRHTLAALLLVAAPLAAQQRQREAPPRGGQPRDFRLAEPRTFTLDNGIGVTLVQYGDVPKANVALTVRSGNLNEAANEVWLADLTGDLMQEDDPQRRPGRRGRGGMGGQVSSTSGSMRHHRRRLLAVEFAPEFVRLLADVARNSGLLAEVPRINKETGCATCRFSCAPPSRRRWRGSARTCTRTTRTAASSPPRIRSTATPSSRSGPSMPPTGAPRGRT